MRRFFVVALSLALGCGGLGPRTASRMREELAARGLEAASTVVPDRVARVVTALEDAEVSERAGDTIAAADHRARASLLAETALASAELAALDEAQHDEEAAAIVAEDELVRLEAEALEARAEASRLASARAAREELRRALARAATEESSGRRSRRLSLDEGHDLRAAAQAIRARARLLLSAAAALGASEEARRVALDLLGRSEAETDLLRALSLSDEAHDAARLVLGAARRAHGGATPAEARSLADALEEEGFTVVALERGVGAEIDDLFSGSSSTPNAAARARLGRLATIVSSYADGPVRVEVDVTGRDDAERLAGSRGDAVLAALTAGGVPADRLAHDGAPILRAANRVRVLFTAYSISPALVTGAAAADGGSAAALPAEPTPSE